MAQNATSFEEGIVLADTAASTHEEDKHDLNDVDVERRMTDFKDV